MAGANSELQYQVQLTPRARESDAKIVSYYTSNYYKTNKLVGWKISQFRIVDISCSHRLLAANFFWFRLLIGSKLRKVTITMRGIECTHFEI